MDLIRILLVDDQPSVRRGLKMRLELEPDISVVGEAEDGFAALRATADLLPDVLVLDYEMPGMDGVETTRALTSTSSPASVVMLSIHDNPTVKSAAASAGAHSFVAKHEPSETLLAAIRAAASAKRKEHG
jgi:DNA-binding NarL/FixJ family response regulator